MFLGIIRGTLPPVSLQGITGHPGPFYALAAVPGEAEDNGSPLAACDGFDQPRSSAQGLLDLRGCPEAISQCTGPTSLQSAVADRSILTASLREEDYRYLPPPISSMVMKTAIGRVRPNNPQWTGGIAERDGPRDGKQGSSSRREGIHRGSMHATLDAEPHPVFGH